MKQSNRISQRLIDLAATLNKDTDTSKDKWDYEPDFVDLEIKDYHLVIFRNSATGALNGYVGVTRNHPYFAVEYDTKRAGSIEVHGGLTFSGKGHLKECKKKYWYFGFDTSHFLDLAPYQERLYKSLREQMKFPFQNKYRDIQYVSKEIEKLLDQLIDIKTKNPNYKYSHVKEYKRLARIKRREQSLNMWLKNFSLG